MTLLEFLIHHHEQKQRDGMLLGARFLEMFILGQATSIPGWYRSFLVGDEAAVKIIVMWRAQRGYLGEDMPPLRKGSNKWRARALSK